MDMEFTYQGAPVSKNEGIVNELHTAKEAFRRRRDVLAAEAEALRTPSFTKNEMVAKGVRLAFHDISFKSEVAALRYGIRLCDKLSACAKAGALRSGDAELQFVRKLVKSIK